MENAKIPRTKKMLIWLPILEQMALEISQILNINTQNKYANDC